MKPDIHLQEIGYRIADFYLQKNNNNYEAAEKEVQTLKIRDLKLDGRTGTLTICTSRPGLLIGHKGINIDNLHSFLLNKNGVKAIHIEEVKFDWEDILVPQRLDDYLLGCDAGDKYDYRDLYD